MLRHGRRISPQLEAIGCDQCFQRKFAEQGGSQQPDHTLTQHKHTFANDRRGVLHQVDSRFHIGEKAGRLGGKGCGHWEERIVIYNEMRGVRLKGKNKLIAQGTVYLFPCLPDYTYASVSIRERIFKIPAQTCNHGIRFDVPREASLVHEHFSASADRRTNRLDQNVLWAEFRKSFFAKLHLSWRGEIESLSFHSPILPCIMAGSYP